MPVFYSRTAGANSHANSKQLDFISAGCQMLQPPSSMIQFASSRGLFLEGNVAKKGVLSCQRHPHPNLDRLSLPSDPNGIVRQVFPGHGLQSSKGLQTFPGARARLLAIPSVLSPGRALVVPHLLFFSRDLGCQHATLELSNLSQKPQQPECSQ